MNKIEAVLIVAVLLNCLIDGIHSNLTLEELAEVAGAFRKQCQTQTEVSDDLIDGINMGEFPKDHNLMCYTHCLLNSFRMVRRGKINIEQVTKQVKTFLPEFMRDEWLKGIAACKNHGDEIEDQCERTYAKIECFYKNNEHFMLP